MLSISTRRLPIIARPHPWAQNTTSAEGATENLAAHKPWPSTRKLCSTTSRRNHSSNARTAVEVWQRGRLESALLDAARTCGRKFKDQAAVISTVMYWAIDGCLSNPYILVCNDFGNQSYGPIISLAFLVVATSSSSSSILRCGCRVVARHASQSIDVGVAAKDDKQTPVPDKLRPVRRHGLPVE